MPTIAGRSVNLSIFAPDLTSIRMLSHRHRADYTLYPDPVLAQRVMQFFAQANRLAALHTPSSEFKITLEWYSDPIVLA